jgi:hypothetical protein
VENGLEPWRTVQLRLLPGDRSLPAVTLAQGETARLPLFAAELPYRQHLLWQAQGSFDRAGHWRFSEGRGGIPEEPVIEVVEIRNGGRMPWLAGPLLWLEDEGPWAETALPETPSRGTARIPRGTVEGVTTAQREVVIDGEEGALPSWDRLTLTAVLAVRNTTAEAVEVLVEKELVGQLLDAEPFPESLPEEVQSEPQAADAAGDPNPRHHLRWSLVVPGRETAEIRYRYRLYARP